MNYTKFISFLFASVICIYFQNLKAQSLNINGDTIFVNTDAEIQIIFPTLPEAFSTIPAKTQYRIWKTEAGINFIPALEDHTPVVLLVSEAGRKHRFNIIYKKEIDIDEAKLYYDYSTEKKLVQHIRETAVSRPTEIGIANRKQ